MKQYAVADVDAEGKLPSDYRRIQWWGVPYGTHTNIPDQDCLLTLESAVRHAIGLHVMYARATGKHRYAQATRKYGDALLSSHMPPQGIVHVTPDGFRELAWAWWDDYLGEGHPIIRIQARGRTDEYGGHYVLPKDHPQLVDKAVRRMVECLS